MTTSELKTLKPTLLSFIQDEKIASSSGAERLIRDFINENDLNKYSSIEDFLWKFIEYLEDQTDSQLSPHSILQTIYNKKGHTSFKPVPAIHKTERVRAILDQFSNIGRVELDRFTLHGTRDFTNDPEITNHRLNIYFYPKDLDSKKKTIILLAHYDVVHPESHNVADNLASVASVIFIGKKAAKLSLPVNIIVALTDAEEIVSFTSSGSKRLANKIKTGYFGDVLETINIEVAARGTIRWVNGKGSLAKNISFKPVDIPYSDTTVLLANGIPSVCIGIFTDTDLKQVKYYGTCETWRLCHSPNDKFELANKQDMNEFACWLLNYLEDFKY